MVGAAGIEPATSGPPCQRSASELRPVFFQKRDEFRQRLALTSYAPLLRNWANSAAKAASSARNDESKNITPKKEKINPFLEESLERETNPGFVDFVPAEGHWEKALPRKGFLLARLPRR